jgi:hypothetical protein
MPRMIAAHDAPPALLTAEFRHLPQPRFVGPFHPGCCGARSLPSPPVFFLHGALERHEQIPGLVFGDWGRKDPLPRGRLGVGQVVGPKGRFEKGVNEL